MNQYDPENLSNLLNFEDHLYLMDKCKKTNQNN